MGPRTGLDRCGKSRPPQGFDPRTVQPVVSRYTDRATGPTLCVLYVNVIYFSEGQGQAVCRWTHYRTGPVSLPGQSV
jgi:hypothetical protein